MQISRSSEYYSVHHGPKALHDILVQRLINARGKVILGVHLADRAHDKLLLSLLILFLDPLVIFSSQLRHIFKRSLSLTLLLFEISVLQCLSPVYFIEVKQHLLLELVLAIVHGDRVVVLAEAVSDGD